MNNKENKMVGIDFEASGPVETDHGEYVYRKDAEAEISKRDSRISKLEAVLREIADGELLDTVGNRNDNGMQDYLHTPPCAKQIAEWLRKIRKVLA